MFESIIPSVNSLEADLRLLASPYVALGCLAPIALALARIFYIGGRDRSALYWKKAGLAADVMSIVGLIGLSVFAGRTLLDEDLRAARAAEQAAGLELQNRLSSAAMAACVPLLRDKGPTRRVADSIEFCNAIKGMGGVWDININWDSRYKQLLNIPPDNGYVNEARNIGALIKTFTEARIHVPQAEWASTLTTQLTSATLIVACLAIAICSLALKLAKSSWEIKDQSAKLKSLTK